MKKLLALIIAFTVSVAATFAVAQEQPKAEKAKSSCCAPKVSTIKASNNAGDVNVTTASVTGEVKASTKSHCDVDVKTMKASNKAGKSDCCATGAKAMKASNKKSDCCDMKDCDMDMANCDMSKCDDDCKMAHTKTDAKSTNKN